MNKTYFCRQCGRIAYVRIDNKTYCPKCGEGVMLMVVPDESRAYGMDCRDGKCEF